MTEFVTGVNMYQSFDISPLIVAILVSSAGVIVAIVAAVDCLKRGIVDSLDQMQEDTLAIAADIEGMSEQVAGIRDRLNLVTQAVIFDGKNPDSGANS